MTQVVFEGATVIVWGHPMVASSVRWEDDRVTFKGTCTDSDANDGIRDTGYNGGSYAGNGLLYRRPD